MTQRLIAPGLEASGGWVWSSPGGTRSDAYGARSGSWAGLLVISRPFLGIDPYTGQPLYGAWYSGWGRQTHAVNLGEIIHLETWVKLYSGTGGSIELRAQNPASEAAVVIDSASNPTDWTRLSGKVVAEGTDFAIEVALVKSTDDTSWWLFDDCFSGEQGDNEMALLLAERAVAAMGERLQSTLATKLADIVSERGDSLSLPSPDAWDSVERTWDRSHQVAVEVWAGPVSFPTPERDLSTWHAGAVPTVQSECEINVRLAHANRDAISKAKMTQRSQRYAAAIMRVVRDDPTLNGEVGWCWPVDVAISDEGEGREVVHDRVHLRFGVRFNETDAGEGTAGGGVAATYAVTA